MVGALSAVGSSVVESHTSPFLCLDSLPTSASLKSGGDVVGLRRSPWGREQLWRPGSLELGSSFLDSWNHRRLHAKSVPRNMSRRFSNKPRKHRSFKIASEVAGQYEDSFEDVKTQILNYFTYKAVRTVLNQLYEMNPTQYRWLYEFVATNKPGDGKRFISILGKEKHDLAERVMITRLHLYGKWIKKCNHAEIYQEISDENLELMRERLMETVIWPSDDTNTEKIG
ncbi:chaperonin-like RbcX protein 2, chloroplastic isoform X2 [Rhodamnia argentea]|uniref:Chaperonin-like RbcX protein 2, chloroplastic isoform X2 n=1 Tax=Rhodamnia argentea TaxID=178133 RepID=A0A8B8NF93_9MYRT|nr:chaperonin-like RbcX protein 2, chloroplastic isoform X2 [Rhodamnia argentea]